MITVIQDEKGVREEQMKCCGIHGVRKLFTFEVIFEQCCERQTRWFGGREAKNRYTGRRKAQRCRGLTRLFHFPRL